MVAPMEQWASQTFQDKSADLGVVLLSDHSEKYSDMMERFYKAFAVTFELRFPFPLTHWSRDEMGNISQTTFSSYFFSENVWVSIEISRKFVPNGQINNIPSLFQIMALRRPRNKPLSEPMMVSFPTHICVTRSQCVKYCMQRNKE